MFHKFITSMCDFNNYLYQFEISMMNVIIRERNTRDNLTQSQTPNSYYIGICDSIYRRNFGTFW